LKLLLDNNLPPRVAHCLQALFEREHVIRALRDWMPGDVPDVEWIKSLDQDGGWAVLTRDLRIRTRPHEREALDRSRIVYFFLAGQWRRIGVEETASRLIRWVPKMAVLVEQVERGRFELPINAGSRLRPQRD
jgi:hypothetical protein